MRMDGTWASELEIRALEEIVDRIFSIYSSGAWDWDLWEALWDLLIPLPL